MKLGLFVNEVQTELPQYTSTCLALEAVQRGHEVWYIEAGDFAHETDDLLYAHARRAPKKKYDSLEEYLGDVQGEKAKAERILVEDLDVLMLRNDPSLELTKRPWAQNAGVIFGQVAADRGVLVLNDPHGLAQALNKLYFLQFPASVRPSTLVTRSTEDVQAFVRDHDGVAVIKPLSGSGGQGVFLVREVANLNQMIEAVARDGYVMVQEYLPAAEKGDVRLFLVNGVPFEHNGKYAAFARIRKGKDMRSNMRVGGQAEKARITDEMLELAEAVRPKLIRDGMFFVGLDVAGDKLMEINVFSPGGLHSASKLTKVNFVGKMIDALERKVEYERLDRKVTNTELAML